MLTTNGFESYVGDQDIFLKKSCQSLKTKGRFIFDIATGALGDKYTQKFYKKWDREITNKVRGKKPSLRNDGIKNCLGKGLNNEDMVILLAKMKKLGFFVSIKKYRESWNPKKELAMWERIPARTDFWMKGITFTVRKKILRETMQKVIKDIGFKPLVKYRFFFFAYKK